MTHEELDKIALHLLSDARRLLAGCKRGESFPRALIGRVRDGSEVRLFQYNLGTCSREEAPSVVKRLEAQYRFEWLAHVTDMWVKRLQRDNVQLPLRPASRYADREEGLFAEVKSGELFTWTMQIYKRDRSGKPIFEAPKVKRPHQPGSSRILGVGPPIDCDKNPFEGT